MSKNNVAARKAAGNDHNDACPASERQKRTSAHQHEEEDAAIHPDDARDTAILEALEMLERAELGTRETMEAVLEWLPFGRTGANIMINAAGELTDASAEHVSHSLTENAEMLRNGVAEIATNAQTGLMQVLLGVREASKTLRAQLEAP